MCQSNEMPTNVVEFKPAGEEAVCNHDVPNLDNVVEGLEAEAPELTPEQMKELSEKFFKQQAAQSFSQFLDNIYEQQMSNTIVDILIKHGLTTDEEFKTVFRENIFKQVDLLQQNILTSLEEVKGKEQENEEVAQEVYVQKALLDIISDWKAEVEKENA